MADIATIMTAENTRWYAVRCCCTPQKILGFLRVNKIKVPDGRNPYVHVKAADGNDHKIAFRVICDALAADSGDIAFQEELAIYSEDRSIEFWRGVPGFVDTMQ